MKAVVNNPGGPAIMAVDDPRPGSGEALIAVRTFSINRGEPDLLQTRTDRWPPGQDIAGVVPSGCDWKLDALTTSAPAMMAVRTTAASALMATPGREVTSVAPSISNYAGNTKETAP